MMISELTIKTMKITTSASKPPVMSTVDIWVLSFSSSWGLLEFEVGAERGDQRHSSVNADDNDPLTRFDH